MATLIILMLLVVISTKNHIFRDYFSYRKQGRKSSKAKNTDQINRISSHLTLTPHSDTSQNGQSPIFK